MTNPGLEQQNAIVTGGGRGIGRAIAQSLASAGAGVAVVARSASEIAETVSLLEEDGGRGLAWVADVRDRRSVEKMVEQVESRLGPVDLLVNNAGTGSAIGPTWEMDADIWWQDVEVVLRGAFLCSQAVLAGMVGRGRGRIVNVTSRTGASGIRYQTAYSCSRAALFQFSNGLAKELEQHGISVFALTPGLVRTALTDHILNSEAGQRWLPQFKAMVAGGKAWVDPKTVGDAVVVLASGRADALSGRWIHAQDDLDALIRKAKQIQAQDLQVLRLRQ